MTKQGDIYVVDDFKIGGNDKKMKKQLKNNNNGKEKKQTKRKKIKRWINSFCFLFLFQMVQWT